MGLTLQSNCVNQWWVVFVIGNLTSTSLPSHPATDGSPVSREGLDVAQPPDRLDTLTLPCTSPESCTSSSPRRTHSNRYGTVGPQVGRPPRPKARTRTVLVAPNKGVDPAPPQTTPQRLRESRRDGFGDLNLSTLWSPSLPTRSIGSRPPAAPPPRQRQPYPRDRDGEGEGIHP